MQNVTHQIASDVTALAERYETTLNDTETHVKDLEQEVLRSLKEMGFTL
jgi:type I restriction enzyme M protein